MAIHSPQGAKHLRWCANRALEEFDYSGPSSALASVMSDFTKDSTTAQVNPMMVMAIVGPAAEQGRAQLEKAIMGFNV